MALAGDRTHVNAVAAAVLLALGACPDRALALDAVCRDPATGVAVGNAGAAGDQVDRVVAAVDDLVARGRHPHHSPLRQWSRADDTAVTAAMASTGVSDLATRFVDELSGGQRQRVWVAMLLAQETPILLLDEPTTYLDIAHQYDVLDLLRDQHESGRAVIAVLHDLNQAARFASRLIVMHEGGVAGDGPPERVLTGDLVREVFGLGAEVVDDPQSGTPMVVPHVRVS